MIVSFLRNKAARIGSRLSSSSKASTCNIDGSLTELGAMIEAQRCLLCVDAPCAKACPADTKPDKFLRQLRFENPLGGAETILDNNPLGGVCGTVCPTSKLCEGACTRNSIDGPVKIGAVQRYLHDYGVHHNLELPPVPQKSSGHRTAVIGAGPAGLAAARELARRGSLVTVFEKRAEAGGALRYALSPLRINHQHVEEEVKRIERMGVKFVYNADIHSPTSLKESGNFDAVFLSPGLQQSRAVHFDMSDAWTTASEKKIIGALSFLESANTAQALFAKEVVQDQHIVVIGGGSVAMDCVITAKSLGAKSIHLVAREQILDFPADEEEIRLARNAGAVFHPEAQVIRVSGDHEVHLQHITVSSSSPQHSGSSSVTPFQATLHATTILVAAGQRLDPTGESLIQHHVHGKSTGWDIKYLNDDISNGVVQHNATSYFAGGDAVRGGGDTVVQAVADGKRAAIEILPSQQPAPRKPYTLQTNFLGLQFENPFTLSSSPVTNSAEMIARAYEAGFAGSYYKTLNREDKFVISHPSPRLSVVHGSTECYDRMAVGIQNMEQISDRPLADNLKDIAWLRKSYPTKITAVSIMGYCDEDWDYLARAAEGAGAHLLELNFSCPQMARSDAGHHVGQQLDLIQRYTNVVKRAVNIPVVAKLTPNITDMIPAALAAQAGGADAISAINTVKSISHIDLDTFSPLPTIQGKSAVSGFSGKGCRPIGLRFVSELARETRLRIPISGMGGIYTWRDATEYLAVGASNLQVTTSVMQHGVRVVEDMIDGLQRYLDRNQFRSTKEIIGRANQSIVKPEQLDTLSEVVSVIDEQLCIGCGICEVACRDGANHAISMKEEVTTGGKQQRKIVPKKAVVDKQACVGCKLCQFVCPVGAITFETRARIDRPRFSK